MTLKKCNLILFLKSYSSKDDESITENITLPMNSTFLHMRLKIIEIFNFKTNDFELLVGPNSIKLPPENEEEYSLLVFGISQFI